MKVFHLIDDPYCANINPYVGTLIDGMKNIACDVEFGYGYNAFWDDVLFRFDILHIHWPDLLPTDNRTQSDLELYIDRLQKFKTHGRKLIVTCHNLKPHYCSNPCEEEAYEKVYSLADIMIHLGGYSLRLMEKEYPNAKHVLCYHHTYDSLYYQIERDSCIKKLHLNPSKKYILCFGDFRDDEERVLVDKVSKYFHTKGVELLAPGYYRIVKRRNVMMLCRQWLKIKLKELMTPGLHIYGRFVPNELLPYFYGASEVALIQRKKILNSGNLPIGFYFGRVVVGPNVGNVGEILESTGNPSFSPDDNDSIFAAVNLGLDLQSRGKGVTNCEYARKYFSTRAVCTKLYDIYRSALDTKIAAIDIN